MLPVGLTDIVDAAATAHERGEYERPLFELLDRSIGFDIAFVVRPDGLGSHAPGFDPELRQRIHDSAGQGPLAQCAHEYANMRERALLRDGVAVDAEYFGRAAFERTQTYREVIQPHRGRCSLLLFLPHATLVLGRVRSDFRATERQTLASMRSLISVCEQALTSRISPPSAAAPEMFSARLTARERELVGYLRLGYTNREIASACGTSFRTVRNQLSSVFEKLEVSTRAEAVARSFELALASD